MAAQGFRIMDADGHIMEPAGMWERYITPAFRERAPRVVRGADGRSRIVVGAWPARATRATTASAPMREAFAVRTRELLGEYARADYDSESQIRAVGASGVDVAFLSMNGAKLTTGEQLYIDGGYHIID